MFKNIIILFTLFFSNSYAQEKNFNNNYKKNQNNNDFKNYPSEISEEIKNQLINPFLIGQYDLSVVGFDVYNIKLYSQKERFTYNSKFAIEIIYKMNFTKENLAKRSVEEISRIQKISDKKQLSAYKDKFIKIFIDVKKGDKKIAIFNPTTGVDLFFNNKLVGSIDDQILARYFVDIWLSKDSSYPKMTSAILGNKND